VLSKPLADSFAVGQRQKWHGIGKLLNKTFFVFGSTCRIFVSAKYSAEKVFGLSLLVIAFNIFMYNYKYTLLVVIKRFFIFISHAIYHIILSLLGLNRLGLHLPFLPLS
jgi:hypothetical protein